MLGHYCNCWDYWLNPQGPQKGKRKSLLGGDFWVTFEERKGGTVHPCLARTFGRPRTTMWPMATTLQRWKRLEFPMLSSFELPFDKSMILIHGMCGREYKKACVLAHVTYEWCYVAPWLICKHQMLMLKWDNDVYRCYLQLSNANVKYDTMLCLGTNPPCWMST